MVVKNNNYCVIMAGGVGTRFWPMSRQKSPKQFLDILGTGRSFIRHTYERFAKIVPNENFIVVTNRRYKELVLEHITSLRSARQNKTTTSYGKSHLVNLRYTTKLIFKCKIHNIFKDTARKTGCV